MESPLEIKWINFFYRRAQQVTVSLSSLKLCHYIIRLRKAEEILEI